MPLIDSIAEKLHLKNHNQATDTTLKKKPVFDNSKVTVIYVLGGPGAGEINKHSRFPPTQQISHSLYFFFFFQGKGTQCARLVEDFGFCHLSGMIIDDRFCCCCS
jgi:UMP-CMP kinase